MDIHGVHVVRGENRLSVDGVNIEKVDGVWIEVVGSRGDCCFALWRKMVGDGKHEWSCG